MPVNVAVEEPRARVIGVETEGYIVTCSANIDNITSDRVGVVVGGATRNADNIKVVPMQMERVLWLRCQ